MRRFAIAISAAAILLSGCANTMTDTQRGTATGAAIGALGGAAIGSVSGGRAGTGAAVGALAGAAGGYLWSQRMENQKRQMEAATRGTGVTVSQTASNELKLDIPSDISFDVGRSVIKPDFAPVLDQFAVNLRNGPPADIRIVGHTDSTGTPAINDPLSVQRAAATRDYLVAHGVPANEIRIEGRGAREPIGDNATAAGRAQNRRVEIFIGERQG